MPETIRHANGTTASRRNGISTAPETPTAEKPALEAAIDKHDGFKTSVPEALGELNDLTALHRQALRDQKTSEITASQGRQPSWSSSR